MARSANSPQKLGVRPMPRRWNYRLGRATILIVAIATSPCHCVWAQTNGVSAPSPEISVERPTYRPVALMPRVDDDSKAQSFKPSTRASSIPILTIASSLLIVLGLFAALVWVSKRTGLTRPVGRRGGELPEEVLSVLGRRTLGPQTHITLLRCGGSILVVAVSPSGIQKISEINADDEVRRIDALCTGTAKASFQETLAEIEREPIRRGFVGDVSVMDQPKRRLFHS